MVRPSLVLNECMELPGHVVLASGQNATLRPKCFARYSMRCKGMMLLVSYAVCGTDTGYDAIRRGGGERGGGREQQGGREGGRRGGGRGGGG
eukprot:3161754-Rhodomonas_salina.1